MDTDNQDGSQLDSASVDSQVDTTPPTIDPLEALSNLDGDESEQAEDSTPDATDSEDPEQPAGEESADGLDDWTDGTGKVWKVPKELVQGNLRQADYTKKTSETAREREAVVKQREVADRIFENAQANTKLLAAITNTQAELAKYDALPWSQIHAEKPELYSAARVDHLEAKQRLHDQLTQLSQLSAERNKQRINEAQEAWVKGRQYLIDTVGYNQTAAQNITRILTSEFGFQPQELIGAEADPRAVRVALALVKAREELAAFKTAKAKTTSLSRAPTAQPGARTSTQSNRTLMTRIRAGDGNAALEALSNL